MPLRRQLSGLIPRGARVLDIGCANGRLLHELAGKIDLGLGIDLDRSMIRYARAKAESQGIPNLQFVEQDALSALKRLPFEPTHALASLFLHALPLEQAAAILEKLVAMAGHVILADFVEPSSPIQKAFLHFDEWLAGHYDRYLAYRAAGGMPALVNKTGLEILETFPAPVPGIHVWVCG